MKSCYHCGKEIKTKREVVIVPANYLIKAGVDFIKAFHPGCYKKAEQKAKKELHK